MSSEDPPRGMGNFEGTVLPAHCDVSQCYPVVSNFDVSTAVAVCTCEHKQQVSSDMIDSLILIVAEITQCFVGSISSP